MAELLNLVGLSAGVVLYAMLLVMVVRAGRRTAVSRRVDPLLLVTAILGLTWNLCALPAYELPKVGIAGPFRLLAVIGFSALGFLPAVVVHSVLRGERDGVRDPRKRVLAMVAYSVSGFAALLHFASAWTSGPVPSVVGMRLLTYTFVALVIPLVAVTRGQRGARRALWAAALATFAVSALHLSQLHRGDASWPVELVGHHASLPLAFAILYQDYPFALADLFLKRALVLLSLLALAFGAILLFGQPSVVFMHFVQLDPRQMGVLSALSVVTALVYPALRRSIAWFVDSVILHRPDYGSLRRVMTRRLSTHDDVPRLMADVCERLAPALSATAVSWRTWTGADEGLGLVLAGTDAMECLRRSGSAGTASAPIGTIAALAIVPTTEPPRYAILFAELTGGRRFLSDDLAAVEAIVILAARRIDAIRITNERYQREIREAEIGKLASEAELRALRAQVNPHFLFNALTTIGHLIQTTPPRALQTLMRLTALLRAVLRSEGEFTTLGRELEVIESYLDIEKARFEHRLNVTIDVPLHLRAFRVPPLLLQPIVENAVKHGIAPQRDGGHVTVRARVARSQPESSELVLMVHDTGAGTSPDALRLGRDAGVGLRNVERRLALQYGAAASLSIGTVSGEGTTVEIRLPVDRKTAVEPALARVGR
jgi:two-component system LytT family sensor kinase